MHPSPYSALLKFFLLACMGLIATGCASVKGPTSKLDPLESYNRTMFSINTSVDKAVLKPAAQVYDKTLPGTIKKGIRNFFSNIGEIPVVFNDLMQLRFQQAAYDTSRFLLNSTLGLGGFVDFANDAGLEKNNQDFGQTLGKWGVPSGPYFVLPVLGPSTVRDTFGRVVDSPFKGYSRYIPSTSGQVAAYGLDAVSTRQSLLGASNVLGEAALDPYIFVRDAYLQRRLKQIYDGKVPQDKQDELEESLDPEPVAAPKTETKPDATK
jgi:phospholipid-binding lipoprotein MlaA